MKTLPHARSVKFANFFGIDLIKRLAFQKSQKSAKSLHPTVRGGPRPRFELGTGDLYYVLVHTYILAQVEVSLQVADGVELEVPALIGGVVLLLQKYAQMYNFFIE